MTITLHVLYVTLDQDLAAGFLLSIGGGTSTHEITRLRKQMSDKQFYSLMGTHSLRGKCHLPGLMIPIGPEYAGDLIDSGCAHSEKAGKLFEDYSSYRAGQRTLPPFAVMKCAIRAHLYSFTRGIRHWDLDNDVFPSDEDIIADIVPTLLWMPESYQSVVKDVATILKRVSSEAYWQQDGSLAAAASYPTPTHAREIEGVNLRLAGLAADLAGDLHGQSIMSNRVRDGVWDLLR